jgi:hypothetical protein
VAEALPRVVGSPDGSWCIGGRYAGNLVGFAEDSGLEDLDGDCIEEATVEELAGLAELQAQGKATATLRLMAGEIVRTTLTTFELVDPPVCVPEPAPQPTPTPEPTPDPTPEPTPKPASTTEPPTASDGASVPPAT